MKYYLITLLFVLPQFFLFSQKEPIVLRKIEATPAVRKLAPPSLDSYLQALPVHFITYLNKTGKYAVVELDSIVSESNLDAELSYSDIFEAAEKKMIRKPKYILNCRVTAFVEKETKMTNPLDDSIRLNRDIFVSASMQLINRDRPEDQKTFEVPEYNGQWDEDLFGTQSGGDLARIKKIEQFAKESARLMAENFAAGFEHPSWRLRLTHYPPVPEMLEEDADFGIAPHVDTTCFTLLVQNAAGLTIYSHQRGCWIQAPVVPDAFVVNSGELLRQWTNDRYLSVRHFANNAAAGSRYSIPFFYNAAADYPMECLPTCQGPGNPPKYPTISYEQSQAIAQGE